MARRRRTLEEREAISRGLRRWNERRRLAAERHLERVRVGPQDLLAIEGGHIETVRPELLPLVSAGADEAHALLVAMGGPDVASPQRTIAAHDFGRLGAVLRGLLLRWAQTADPELASRIATVSGARRSLLAMIGLDERREEKSLDEYLRQRQDQDGAGSTIDVAPDPMPAPPADRAAGGDAAPEEPS